MGEVVTVLLADMLEECRLKLESFTRTWSLRQKIVAVAMLASVAVAAMLGVYAAVSEYRARAISLQESLASATRISGLNASAALAFEDREAAAEVLAALQAHEDVLSGTIRDAEGAVFSRFDAPRNHSLGVGRLKIVEPISHGSQKLGDIEVVASTNRLEDALLRQAVIGLVALVAALGLAWIVASRLERWVTGPIEELSVVVRSVTGRGHYSMRAKRTTDDELGELIDGFNEMLAQIQQRDAALEEAVAAVGNARDAAEAGSRAKSRFLATMSHEIRTPMNGVLGLSELLARTPLNKQQADYVGLIRKSGSALLGIIDDVLDFSKIEAGKSTLDRLPFDPVDTIEGVAMLLAPRAREKRLSLICLPDPAIQSVVLGDANRLRQVLLNLVGNSIKFTESGKVVIRARLQSLDGGCMRIRIEVEDTGIGMTADAAEKIFDPFTQADESTTRRFGGTGLGLAICRQLIELMQGRIGVTSTVGHGSLFWIEVAFDSLETVPDGQAEAEVLRGQTVAAVCADREMAAHLVRQLRGWCMQVREIEANDPECVLAELERLQRIDPQLRIVAVDAWRDGPSRWQASGLNHVIAAESPLRRELLRSALLENLGAVTMSAPASAPRQDQLTLSRSVMLVEDNSINRVIASEMLQSLGCSVVIAVDGQEAVDLLLSGAMLPDIVLMDVHMPRMDGLRATTEIRRAPMAALRSLPIVALTANAMAGDREACIAAGMDDYLSKPFSIADLQGILERWASLPVGPSNVQSRG